MIQRQHRQMRLRATGAALHSCAPEKIPGGGRRDRQERMGNREGGLVPAQSFPGGLWNPVAKPGLAVGLELQEMVL